MIYSVFLLLPHTWLIGQIHFEDVPDIGEFVEITPRAKFKVTELDSIKKTVTLRFEVIFHDSDIRSILLQEFDFKESGW